MHNEDLYSALLKLSEPWYISQINVGVHEESVHVFINHSPGPLPCPECGKLCPVHDHTESRTWRHLDLWQCKTWLHCELPRTHCEEHGVRRVSTPWSDPNSRFTFAMEARVIEALQSCQTTQAAARLMRISWDECRGIMDARRCSW